MEGEILGKKLSEEKNAEARESFTMIIKVH